MCERTIYYNVSYSLMSRYNTQYDIRLMRLDIMQAITNSCTYDDDV